MTATPATPSHCTAASSESSGAHANRTTQSSASVQPTTPEPSVASRSEQAARYAIETGCTNREAAERFGISDAAVARGRTKVTGASRKPGRPHGRVSTCTACGEVGHNARNGLCSASFLAVEMVLDGDAQNAAEAARAVGISHQAVSQRIRGRR